jgi:orotidine-5'-phosphate decarboxylase
LKLEKRNHIILALDVTEREKALSIAREVAEHVDGIKVGYPLLLGAGMGVLEELRALGKPIIADLKVADIPEISAQICRLAREGGADYVIVQGFVGRDVLEACASVIDIFVVVEMSHPGAKDFLAEKAEGILEKCRDLASGIVAPATRPERIRLFRERGGENLVIISPGVKAQGAPLGRALRAGADYEIIGRGITQDPDPGERAREYAEVLRALFPEEPRG